MKYFILITFLAVSIYSQQDSVRKIKSSNKDEFKSEFNMGVGLIASKGYESSFSHGFDFSYHFELGVYGSLGFTHFDNLYSSGDIFLIDLQVRQSFYVTDKILITPGSGFYSLYLPRPLKKLVNLEGHIIVSGKVSYLLQDNFAIGIETKWPLGLYKTPTLITKIVLQYRF